MSNQDTNTDLDVDAQDEEAQPTRLDNLKRRATALGISFSPNIGEQKLAEKIDAALEGKTLIADETQGLADNVEGVHQVTDKSSARERAFLLKRVVIYPVDPRRTQLKGELVFSGNGQIGMVGKYVPFNDKRGYHVPQILLNKLEETTFTEFFSITDALGNEETQVRQRPAFIIQELKPLTQAEIDAIATRQRALPTEEDEA